MPGTLTAETLAAGTEGPKPTRRRKKSRDVASQDIQGKSPFQIAMGRLRQDKLAVSCAVIVLILVLLAVFADVINNLLQISATQDGKYALDNAAALEYDGLPKTGPPLYGFDSAHPLGLEPGTAIDNLAKLLLGIRTSLLVATTATVLSTIIGVVIGLVAGFSRGWLDRIISFVTDLFLSFPFLLGALALTPILVSRFGQNDASLGRATFIALIIILTAFGWMGLARLVRGQVLSLREREFIQAAQVIGVPTWRILFKELLPNLVAPIVIAISLGLPAYVTAEAGLSFLGIGLSGVPSLGQTVNVARPYYEQYPLYLFAPVVTIAVLVLALNLLGDSIRDAFDPKTRR